MQTQILLFVIVGVWLLALSTIFYWFIRFFRRLTKGTGENELTKVLNRILKVQEENSAGIAEIEKEVKKLEEEGRGHIQRVGVVRFNPFKEIGGEHSFSLAILDGENSGGIVTCLHTRQRTRVYMKGIKKGKSELELSGEEKKALEKAIK